MSINSVVISGNLGQDPEIRYFESGNSVTSFNLAVGGYSKGEKTTDWVECKVWGKPGETVVNYCKKGSKIGLTGRLAQEKWQSADGGNRSKLVVVGFQVELLDSKQDNQTQQRPPAPQQQNVGQYGGNDYGRPINDYEDF